MDISIRIGLGTDWTALPRLRIVLMAWAASVAVDFGLHAGLLAPFYDWSSPFLLAPAEAFVRIPVGYMAFLLLAWGLAWLLMRLGVAGVRDGFAVGAATGAVVWAALLIALWSISTAEPVMLLAWWAGQTLELGVAGWVAGAMLGGASTRWVGVRVVVLAVAVIGVALVLQASGYATPPVIID
jgi:hypothetical protein